MPDFILYYLITTSIIRDIVFLLVAYKIIQKLDKMNYEQSITHRRHAGETQGGSTALPEAPAKSTPKRQDAVPLADPSTLAPFLSNPPKPPGGFGTSTSKTNDH